MHFSLRIKSKKKSKRARYIFEERIIWPCPSSRDFLSGMNAQLCHGVQERVAATETRLYLNRPQVVRRMANTPSIESPDARSCPRVYNTRVACENNTTPVPRGARAPRGNFIPPILFPPLKKVERGPRVLSLRLFFRTRRASRRNESHVPREATACTHRTMQRQSSN